MAYAMTPMMRQYIELKEKYSDCLLFFRLGDFYEMFFDDAKTASKELELMLTGRDCGLSEKAPMCGVPYHSVDVYISKLIFKGYKVAICEQLEDPALAKGLVDRDVIRIITPGTVIEERMLQEGVNNYIASIFYADSIIGFSYADVSTGAFFLGELKGKERKKDIIDELTRIHPTEVIANADLFKAADVYSPIQRQYYLEKYNESAFLEDNAVLRLQNHFRVQSLSGFGCNERSAAVRAAGALMQYLDETQKNALSHIHKLTLINRNDYMALDSSTRRNLELTEPLNHEGSKKNTLLYLLNATKTSMGARMLKTWIDCPLLSLEKIQKRLDCVKMLFNDVISREKIREILSGIYDIERLCSKIAYNTVTPRDCRALSETLKKLPSVCGCLRDVSPEVFENVISSVDDMQDIIALIDNTITDDPPASTKDGGYIRPGCNSEIDELRNIRDNSKQWLSSYEQNEREKNGIKNLKIGYNHVFGYYIEVTKAYYSMIPDYYNRKQTLANAERFITPELKEMEEKILTAGDRLLTLESQMFSKLRDVLLNCTDRLQKDASLIAMIDCYQSLAHVAALNGYVCPKMTNGNVISVKSGRHPIVEQSMKESFVPNDVYLDSSDNRLLIITGPNMAGKSTYMRQTALIVLMAHIGSFVPAAQAEICLVDRIFTRIGASDNLSSGQSTFMVEMSEMANILNNATANSLLILDEIGRGTSTFDGLSIAWSILEYISDVKTCGAKTLFATHYHELTELEGKINGIQNFKISVKEIGDDILFLRKIIRGSGDKSFGIQVARLAGLPDNVLLRAKEILLELERSDIAMKKAEKTLQKEHSVQASLFDTNNESMIVRILNELDPDSLSPKQALEEIYTLRAIAMQNGKENA